MKLSSAILKSFKPVANTTTCREFCEFIRYLYVETVSVLSPSCHRAQMMTTSIMGEKVALSVSMVIHPVMTIKFDCCDALYMGLPLKHVQKRPLVQNVSARLLFGVGEG